MWNRPETTVARVMLVLIKSFWFSFLPTISYRFFFLEKKKKKKKPGANAVGFLLNWRVYGIYKKV